MIPIKVYSHVALEREHVQRVEKIFSAKHKGEKVTFEYIIDPKILGGILVIDNDKYYDATVKNFLTQIDRQLNKDAD